MQHQAFIELVAAGALPADAYLKAVNLQATTEEALTEGANLAEQYKEQITHLQTERAHQLQMETVEPQHRLFIELVARGMQITEAYSRTVGIDSTRESCSANGCRLFTRYKAEIATATVIQRRRFQADLQNYSRQNPGTLLSDAEVVERLCAIIKGENGLNGNELSVPSYPDMLRAIELHLRMSGKLSPKTYADALKGTIVTTLK